MTKQKGLVGTGREKWHGTIGGYTNHKCRCKRCTKANTEVKARNTKERSEKKIPKHVHGTTNGYHNYKCRCDKCKAAHKEAKKEYRERLKFS